MFVTNWGDSSQNFLRNVSPLDWKFPKKSAVWTKVNIFLGTFFSFGFDICQGKGGRLTKIPNCLLEIRSDKRFLTFSKHKAGGKGIWKNSEQKNIFSLDAFPYFNLLEGQYLSVHLSNLLSDCHSYIITITVQQRNWHSSDIKM